jgi:hypothetical protein
VSELVQTSGILTVCFAKFGALLCLIHETLGQGACIKLIDHKYKSKYP